MARFELKSSSSSVCWWYCAVAWWLSRWTFYEKSWALRHGYLPCSSERTQKIQGINTQWSVTFCYMTKIEIRLGKRSRTHDLPDTTKKIVTALASYLIWLTISEAWQLNKYCKWNIRKPLQCWGIFVCNVYVIVYVLSITAQRFTFIRKSPSMKSYTAIPVILSLLWGRRISSWTQQNHIPLITVHL